MRAATNLTLALSCAVMATTPAAAQSQDLAGALHGLRLPATFRGSLPCADCEAIRHHLDSRDREPCASWTWTGSQSCQRCRTN
jgi:hypothetical protein